MRSPTLLLVILLLWAQAAFAVPARVIVIRHGEKPDQGPELNERGWQRARGLVLFFKEDPAVSSLGAPAALYAMAPKGEDGSVRAIQTLTPLAQSLRLPIHKDFKKTEVAALASEIMVEPSYATRTVIICWEHAWIPEILKAFGWKDGPDQWPGGDVYDRAWVLDFTGGKPGAFKDVPEHLLPGDSD
ncbi:MAG: histidine phosphatase family protein [Elusimicrobia bacterium]|nr:histidine phosphatase family protein [Elusimicrobiota bacterium]